MLTLPMVVSNSNGVLGRQIQGVIFGAVVFIMVEQEKKEGTQPHEGQKKTQ